MSIYISDKEEIEMLKKWWQENGKFLLGSIIVALLLSAGWRYWQTSKAKDAAMASMIYEQVLSQEASGDFSAVNSGVTDLHVNHPKTPYASLASLMAAQNAVKDNRLDEAVTQLSWVIHHSRNKDFVQIAKLRLARVYLGMKKYEDALTTLNVVEASSYQPLVQELRGDIQFAKGDITGARLSYQNALGALAKDAPNRLLLQIKANQLGQAQSK